MLANHPYEEVAYDIYPLENDLENTGLGAIGEFNKAMNQDDFLHFVKELLGLNSLRFNHFEGKIKRLALCGGAGTSLLSRALSVNADAFLTGDVKYHDFQAATRRILLVDAGHYETEIQVLHIIKELISEKIPTFATLISKADTNFVKYL